MIPLSAKDAPVIGLLAGAVMVYVIVKVLGPSPIALPTEGNESPGSLATVTGETIKNDGLKKLAGSTSVSDISLIVLSSTVQVALAPPER